MYSVYLSNKGQEPLLIFDDRFPSPETALISPSLNIESGLAGSFDATLPPTNIGYSAIEAMKTEVIVKKNGKEKWRGRVLNPSTDFYNQMKIEVEGELTYLTDTFQPQHEYKTETLRQVIEGILSIHNQKVSGANEPFDKTFYVGAVFVSDGDPTGTDKAYRTTDYDTTLNCLKKIADAYKGYFIVKHGDDGKRYLDFVKEFSEICQQRIDFGENLLDFTKSFKMEDLCTVAMPIGGRVQDTDFTEADEMYIYRTEDGRPDGGHEFNYLDTDGILQYRSDITDGQAGVVYFNEYGLKENDKVYFTTRMYGSENPLIWALCDGNGTVYSKKYAGTSETQQIVDINKEAITIPLGADRLRVAYRGGGQPFKVYRQKAESQLDEHFTIAPYGDVDNTEFKHTPGDIYLIYKPLYEKYGWHEKKLEFNNLEKSEDLWNMTTYWLTHTQFEQMVLDVTAFDLSTMNVSYDDIWINMNVPIYSKPHGLTDNLLLPCTKMSIRLGSPEDTQYTLGYTTPTAISDTQANVNADLSKFMEEVPTYSDTFKAIQDNSTAIINAMYSSGYVSFLHDIPGNPNPISAIVIADDPDPDNATKKWVWDMGGLGYQDRANANVQWNNVKVAITMDGTIMGDMIAAHTIFADRIWGETLSLGHVPRTNPITGVVEYNDGDLKVFADDGHRVAAIENDWGITSESEDRIVRHDNQTEYNDGVQVRIRNGYIYGGFKNQVGDTSRTNEYNRISIQGEACTGSIQFYNVYDLDGQGRYGVDVVGRVFGVRSDYICFTDKYDDDNRTMHVGQTGWFNVDGYRLHFVHGLLAEAIPQNNGGE